MVRAVVSRFLLSSLLLVGVAHADETCPQLAGNYFCEDDDFSHDMVVEQKNVDGIEHYNIELVQGREWVMADGKQNGSEVNYTVTTCEEGILHIIEYKKDGEEILNGDYKYSRDQEGNLVSKQDVTFIDGDDRFRFELNFKCKPN